VLPRAIVFEKYLFFLRKARSLRGPIKEMMLLVKKKCGKVEYFSFIQLK